MQPARALGDPASSRIERIGRVLGLAAEVALHEADGPAVEDVDGGIQLGRTQAGARTAAQMPAKLLESCSPSELDFSGWN